MFIDKLKLTRARIKLALFGGNSSTPKTTLGNLSLPKPSLIQPPKPNPIQPPTAAPTGASNPQQPQNAPGFLNNLTNQSPQSLAGMVTNPMFRPITGALLGATGMPGLGFIASQFGPDQGKSWRTLTQGNQLPTQPPGIKQSADNNLSNLEFSAEPKSINRYTINPSQIRGLESQPSGILGKGWQQFRQRSRRQPE
jgi:hypothetical protein